MNLDSPTLLAAQVYSVRTAGASRGGSIGRANPLDRPRNEV